MKKHRLNYREERELREEKKHEKAARMYRAATRRHKNFYYLDKDLEKAA